MYDSNTFFYGVPPLVMGLRISKTNFNYQTRIKR